MNLKIVLAQKIILPHENFRQQLDYNLMTVFETEAEPIQSILDSQTV
jgi:hypothetical protein